MGDNGGARVVPAYCLGGNLGFALPNVLAAKEKLAVEVARLDCVHVDLMCDLIASSTTNFTYHFQVAKARHHQGFEELTADATCPYTQHPRMCSLML